MAKTETQTPNKELEAMIEMASDCYERMNIVNSEPDAAALALLMMPDTKRAKEMLATITHREIIEDSLRIIRGRISKLLP